MSYLETFNRQDCGKGFKSLSAGNLHLRSHGLKSLVPDLVVFFGPSIATNGSFKTHEPGRPL